MKKALLFDGKIVQVEPAENIFPVSVSMTWVDCPDNTVAYRTLYSNGIFSEPPPPAPVVPQSITMRQCRLQLLATGKLALVDAAIAAMPSPQKEAAQIEWDYSAVVQRDSPLIAQLAPALGWNTADDIDAQFIAAAVL
jgi:hypothetical protein